MAEHDAPPPLEGALLEDALERLRELLDDPKVVIIGGVALTLLHAHLSTASPLPQLATTDLDLQGSESDVALAARLLGGKHRIAGFDEATPLTGLVAFRDSDGTDRLLDVLPSPRGVRAERVRERAVPLERSTGALVYVMSPIDCLHSRVANLTIPGRDVAHAMAQLETAVDLVPRYSREQLDAGAEPREIMRLNEEIYGLATRNHEALRLAVIDGVDVTDAVLDDERLTPEHRTIRLPQLRAQLTTERERMARAWHLEPSTPSASAVSPPTGESPDVDRQHGSPPDHASDPET